MAILTDTEACELATNAKNYTLPRLGHLNRIPSTFKADTERFLTGRAIGAIVATLLEDDLKTPQEIGTAVAACLPEVRRHIHMGIAEAVRKAGSTRWERDASSF